MSRWSGAATAARASQPSAVASNRRTGTTSAQCSTCQPAHRKEHR